MTPVEQLRTTLAALSLTAIDARLEGCWRRPRKPNHPMPISWSK